MARLETFRILISLVNEKDFFLHKLDVKNAFLQGELKEEIYMKIPEGMKRSVNLVCKLNKTLYGLRQAPRAWNQVFDEFIRNLGLQQSELDKCLYSGTFGQGKVYILLYVDDILIVGSNECDIDIFKHKLSKRFPMKDLRKPENFLGINIVRSNGTIFLSQPMYLRNLLEKFNILDCKPTATPMETKPKTGASRNTEINKPYRELIGYLMYVMLGTRLDLSAAVNFFSRYQHAQTETLWKGLKRILKYIKGTSDHGSTIQKGRTRRTDLLQRR